jgi:ribosome-binding protein aMBF1 (putative translation factor)
MSNNLEQDWIPVIWKKNKNKKKEEQSIDPTVHKLNIIDNKTIEDNLTIETLAKEDTMLLIKLRNDKKLKQEDVAIALNIKKDIIRDIENGCYPKDKSLFQKIKTYLLNYKSNNL